MIIRQRANFLLHELDDFKKMPDRLYAMARIKFFLTVFLEQTTLRLFIEQIIVYYYKNLVNLDFDYISANSREFLYVALKSCWSIKQEVIKN